MLEKCKLISINLVNCDCKMSLIFCFAGRTLGIYDLSAVVGTALPHAATPANIMAEFRCTGIHPFNWLIFTDQDYSPCAVTDKSDPSSSHRPAASASVSAPLSAVLPVSNGSRSVYPTGCLALLPFLLNVFLLHFRRRQVKVHPPTLLLLYLQVKAQVLLI